MHVDLHVEPNVDVPLYRLDVRQTLPFVFVQGLIDVVVKFGGIDVGKPKQFLLFFVSKDDVDQTIEVWERSTHVDLLRHGFSILLDGGGSIISDQGVGVGGVLSG